MHVSLSDKMGSRRRPLSLCLAVGKEGENQKERSKERRWGQKMAHSALPLPLLPSHSLFPQSYSVLVVVFAWSFVRSFGAAYATTAEGVERKREKENGGWRGKREGGRNVRRIVTGTHIPCSRPK